MNMTLRWSCGSRRTSQTEIRLWRHLLIWSARTRLSARPSPRRRRRPSSTPRAPSGRRAAWCTLTVPCSSRPASSRAPSAWARRTGSPVFQAVDDDVVWAYAAEHRFVIDSKDANFHPLASASKVVAGGSEASRCRHRSRGIRSARTFRLHVEELNCKVPGGAPPSGGGSGLSSCRPGTL